MTAFRTLWTALVVFYEETTVLLAGNLTALALNVPILAAFFLIGLAFIGMDEGSSMGWLFALSAWLLLFLPTPGNVALAGLTRIAAGPDVPRFAAFREAAHTHWRLAVRCSLVSLAVTAALAANVYFYLFLTTGWLRFATILWLYGLLFWLSLHLYLVPLLVHVDGPRVLDLYRRAAFIALGHPGYTIVLLVVLMAVGFAMVVFLPVYVLVGLSMTSLVQATALREIRRRHGDLPAETEEEATRL
jgi:uncharacterized membrane protein YesL